MHCWGLTYGAKPCKEKPKFKVTVARDGYVCGNHVGWILGTLKPGTVATVTVLAKN